MWVINGLLTYGLLLTAASLGNVPNNVETVCICKALPIANTKRAPPQVGQALRLGRPEGDKKGPSPGRALHQSQCEKEEPASCWHKEGTF